MLNLATTSALGRVRLLGTGGIIATGGRFVNRKAPQGWTRAVTSVTGGCTDLDHLVVANCFCPSRREGGSLIFDSKLCFQTFTPEPSLSIEPLYSVIRYVEPHILTERSGFRNDLPFARITRAVSLSDSRMMSLIDLSKRERKGKKGCFVV